MRSTNPYIPMPVEIVKITDEVDTHDIKSFRFKFLNAQDEARFQYLPGQFAELSIYGKGEAPIGIASSPTELGYVEFTVQRAGAVVPGLVTAALHDMEEGGRIGLRGPLGHPWPIEFLEKKNIVVVGGGFAFTTLRSLVQYMLHGDNRPASATSPSFTAPGPRACSAIRMNWPPGKSAATSTPSLPSTREMKPGRAGKDLFPPSARRSPRRPKTPWPSSAARPS